MYKDIRNILSIFNVSLSAKKRTLYPSAPKKSRSVVLTDLLSWYWKYREVNHRYFLYGMDREGFCCHGSHMGHREFRRVRDEMNKSPAYCSNEIPDYLPVVRDKFVFSTLMKSCGIPVAADRALIDRENIKWISTGVKESTIDYLTSNKRSGEFFCKRTDGGKGKDVFLLEKRGSNLCVNYEAVTAENVLQKLKGKWILQEKIVQHRRLKKLYPHAVNTIRVVSVNTGRNVVIFSAVLRSGSGGSNVDNYSAGGVIIGMDDVNGDLSGFGIHNSNSGPKIVVRHPDTLVKFNDFDVPMVRNVYDVVKNAHSWLYGIKTIGWDVAVTENGPVLLEANDQWDGEMVMLFKKDFKKKLLSYYQQKD